MRQIRARVAHRCYQMLWFNQAFIEQYARARGMRFLWSPRIVARYLHTQAGEQPSPLGGWLKSEPWNINTSDAPRPNHTALVRPRCWCCWQCWQREFSRAAHPRVARFPPLVGVVHGAADRARTPAVRLRQCWQVVGLPAARERMTGTLTGFWCFVGVRGTPNERFSHLGD